jgi:dTDP-glucose pyrophosphorylase
MRRLQVVMPMAGLGERFSKVGYVLPKPLIPVDGKAMFLKALESLESIETEIQLSIVIRADTNDRYKLQESINNIYPSANVIILKENTKGACETVLAAKTHLNFELPLLILDCDLFFKSEEFISRIRNRDYDNYDGMLISFYSKDSRYSYVRTKDGVAEETAEKVVISDQALIGSYFWSKAGQFVKFGEKCLEQNIQFPQTEYYVSMAIQSAIQGGLRFCVLPGKFSSFGTPSELDEYINFGDSKE